MTLIEYVIGGLGGDAKSIQNTIDLLKSGATIPFISRYRKEMTGGLDEVQITEIRDSLKKYEDCQARQNSILKSIHDQGKLTDEIQQKINSCFDLSELEDIYLPFKIKRLTRGEKAKKNGLEGLAKLIMSQQITDVSITAEKFLTTEIQTVEHAVQGAKDIISEWINENVLLRSKIRYLFQRKSIVSSKVLKGKQESGEKYKDYFEFSEAIYKIPSHRFLALFRGEREGFLGLKVQPEKEEAISIITRFYLKSDNSCTPILIEACTEAYTRLLCNSMENEIISELKLKADKEAIKVFATNLKQLLLAPPLGAKRVLAIDPGFRTGCKIVCLDEQGNLLTNTTIFPHPPQSERDKASSKLFQLVQSYKIEAIAIGDGTAGRETENLVRKTRFDRDLDVYIVREDGASIYSASPIARKEFPEFDVTVRGAISIGRRLMDPLSELVKIDPKSIGVGQYQHEVDQKLLKESLDDVVISSVNKVGVDVNLASPYLLKYISGLGSTLAENIVKYRIENGKFKSRDELKKVKSLGAKAFEQAAGFLRVSESNNVLDNSSVHPESYKFVEEISKKCRVDIKELVGNSSILDQLKLDDFPHIDKYTFADLINELKKPGRDPRKKAKVFEFNNSIKTIGDLSLGMKLPGIVTNVTDFGAFVSIGIKENGLIHKSNLSDTFVSNPSEHISIHDQIIVEVLEVDIPRKRIGLKRVSNG